MIAAAKILADLVETAFYHVSRQKYGHIAGCNHRPLPRRTAQLG